MMKKKRLTKAKTARPQPRAQPRPKNRYMRNAKLSEYRFLKVLRGFAEDKTARELSSEVGISEKSIRATYRQLREKLIEAALEKPQAFGRAGYFLTKNGNNGAQARLFLHGIGQSEKFADHIKRHAPRLSTTDDAERLIFEVAIRTFCDLAIRENAVIDYPPETKKALQELRAAQAWIKENIESEGFLERYGHVIKAVERTTDQMNRLLEQEKLHSLRAQSRTHHYAQNVLYDDLRRYLLRSPLW